MYSDIEAFEEQPSLYQLLEISIMASFTELRLAYKKMAMLHHPDRHPGAPEEAKQRFQQIQHAYEVLSDALLREEYDKELLHRLFLEVCLKKHCSDGVTQQPLPHFSSHPCPALHSFL